MNNKKTIITVVAVVLFVCLIGAVATVSYSYFSVVTHYDTDASTEKRTTVVTTDVLDVDFISSKYINNNDLTLIKSTEVASKSEKTLFKVSKKTGKTYDIKYDIYLTDFNISDNFISHDFKWELLENGVSILSGDYSNAVSGDRYNLTSTPIVLSEVSADYELRMWLEETNVNQSDLLNGTFTGKVALDIYTVASN